MGSSRELADEIRACRDGASRAHRNPVDAELYGAEHGVPAEPVADAPAPWRIGDRSDPRTVIR